MRPWIAFTLGCVVALSLHNYLLTHVQHSPRCPTFEHDVRTPNCKPCPTTTPCNFPPRAAPAPAAPPLHQPIAALATARQAQQTRPPNKTLPYVVEKYQAGGLSWSDFARNASDAEVAHFFGRSLFEKLEFGHAERSTVCRYLWVKCVVHASQGECVLDGACGWCVDKEICIEKQALATRSLCDPVPGNLLTGQVAHRKKQPDRVLLKYNGTLVGMGKSRTKCINIIIGKYMEVKMHPSPLPLLEFFTSVWPDAFERWQSIRQGRELVHFVLTGFPRTHHAITDLFTLLSKPCYHHGEDLSENTCFVSFNDEILTELEYLPAVDTGTTNSSAGSDAGADAGGAGGGQDVTASGGGSGLLRLGPYQYVKQRLLGYPRRPSATDRPRFCIVHDFSDGMIVNSGPLLQALVNNGSTAGDSLDFQVQRDTTLHELVSEIDACSTVITLSGAWRGTLAFANPGTRFIEIVGPAANSNDTALDPAWLKSLDLDHQQARLTGLKAIGARDAFVPVEELLAVVRAA